VCNDYNDAMGGTDISDQYLWCTVQWEKDKTYQIFYHLLDFTIFNLFITTYMKHGALQFTSGELSMG
jgi:hypothetical protein